MDGRIAIRNPQIGWTNFIVKLLFLKQMKNLKFNQVGHWLARLRKKLCRQSFEESAKCIIAILDLSSIAIKLYFGVPIDYVDVFNASQDVMSIV